MAEKKLIAEHEEQLLLGTHPGVRQPVPIVRWFAETDDSGPKNFVEDLAEFFDINPLYVYHDVNDDGNLEDGYGGQDGLRPWDFWLDYNIARIIVRNRKQQAEKSN